MTGSTFPMKTIYEASYWASAFFLFILTSLALQAEPIVSPEKSPEKQGTPEDQFQLAVALMKGEGVSKDPERAGYWFRKAAEQGNTRAMNALGSLYCEGNGTPVNYQLAKEWFVKALAQKDPEPRAMYNIGHMEEKGLGRKSDMKSALAWYEKASAAGLSKATQHLGEIYYYGDGGIAKDYLKARTYFKKAAEAGEAESMNHLGVMYESGKGGSSDPVMAGKYYLQAAVLLYPRAQNNYGRCLIQGIGMRKDELKGVEWLQMAKLNGDGNAGTELAQLSAVISPGLFEVGIQNAQELWNQGKKKPAE